MKQLTFSMLGLWRTRSRIAGQGQYRMTAVIGVACVASACGDAGPLEPGDDTSYDIDTQEEPLTGGSVVPTAELPINGIVILSTDTSMCSGALLSNRWVLTARHCFCDVNESDPHRVSATIYGSTAAAEDPDRVPLYWVAANRIIRHPSWDVALVQLSQTLPFATPPLIYTGTGTELPGKTAIAGGFGHNRLLTDGTPAGAGESLNISKVKIKKIGSTTASTPYPNFCNPAEQLNASKGPWVVPLPGSEAETQKGDSGSPLFLDGDLGTRQLVGILSGGVSTGEDVYTGIWLVRDWIRTNAPDIMRRSECGTPLPDSTGATAPSIALGPDNGFHVVARQSDGSIGHWRIFGGAITKTGVVPGATTNHVPAIGMEATAASGQPLKLGLAYADTAQRLKYTRWSDGMGFSSPVSVGTVSTNVGPAMSNGGLITYVTSENRVGVTAYDTSTGQFIAPQILPAGSPAVDPTKRISVIYEPAFGIAMLGYRTTSNQWVQAWGSWNDCYPVSGSYWCNPEPPYATANWISASLAYYAGQRVSLVTTRKVNSTDTFATIENRVVYGQPSYEWGKNRSTTALSSQPSVATMGYDTWIAYEDAGVVKVSKTDNCFGNDW